MTRYLKLTIVLAFFISFAACELQNKNEETSVTEKIMQLVEQSSLDKNVMTITGIKDGQIDYDIQDGWEAGWEEDKKHRMYKKAPGDELCRGGGLSFARCVRDAVDDGKCVKVYKDGDDYVGEEMACE